MKITLLFITIAVIYFFQSSTTLSVKTKTVSNRIYPGFTLKSEDSILTFKGIRYLILRKEYYDEKDEILRAIINHDIDYMDWSRAEMLKDKNFFEDNELDRFINAIILNNHQLKINTIKAHIEFTNTKEKKIWYSIPGKKDFLYQIAYR
ncbi:MAG: hypothetical protein V4456_09950 [Bacteroidota bacterium]